MKKTIALMLALMMCVSLLSGCDYFITIQPQLQGGPVELPTAAPPIEPPTTVTLTPVPTEPSADVSPAGSGELKSFTTNIAGSDAGDLILAAGENFQLELAFDPADWNGEVTYSVSDTRYATVSAGGNVVNVNQNSSLYKVILTITAGGLTREIPVYCYGVTADGTG